MKKLIISAAIPLLVILSACQASTTPAPVRTPVVIYEPTLPSPTAIANQALNIVMQDLARQLNLDLVQINVVSLESVDWPDACLGVTVEGKMCAQVVTPGYRIILEVQGKQYEYHTNLTGSNVLLASSPAVAIGKPLVTWQSTTSPCHAAEVGLFGVAVGDCGGALVQSMFTNGDRVTELQAFIKTYQSFSATTLAGIITLNGTGGQSATPSQQRSISEWANLMYMEAIGGRGGAAWGLAFTWHREGGIAGFCQDLVIYRDGIGSASQCGSATPTVPQSFILNSDQLDQLYTYLDSYQAGEINRQDNPGGPDNMTVLMSFYGTGNKTFSDQVQQDLSAYASAMYFSINQ